jgi:hypothetical protein
MIAMGLVLCHSVIPEPDAAVIYLGIGGAHVVEREVSRFFVRATIR